VTSATVVGSGPNGLAAALTLADAGVSVTVLEAADTPGGGTRSSELTLPGLIHDECSAAHPLALDTAFSRRFDLGAHGLTWLWPEVQYAHPLDGGGGAAAYRSMAETAAGLGPDAARWTGVFGPLVAHFDAISEDITAPILGVPGHPVQMARFGLRSAPPASLLARRWRTREGQALFAGVAAHAMRPFTSPLSSAIGVTLATAAHRYGWPVAAGGSRAISDAMIAALTERGGTVQTGVRVDSLADLVGRDLVLLDVAPGAAARICGAGMPGRVRRPLEHFRHGPAAFKVEFAVEGGVPWSYVPACGAGTVHVGGDLAEVRAVEAMVHRGQMPERPFVLVCQQAVADPSRARGNIQPVYSYAHVPAGWDGNATAAIEAQIERFAPGFRNRILARHVRSVAATEAHNANYVGGDIVTGANDPRQMLLRPRLALDPYSLGIPGVYLCSAATPPGAGAHGMCGYNAARFALTYLEHAKR
jgi:phytoene dehydrogenase-like protein